MKKGFTLAETLVTLAVIGVIAGIAVPAIMRTRPNNEMVMFQKAYYLLSRAVNELVNDDSLYQDKDDPNYSGFSNTDRVEYMGEEYGCTDPNDAEEGCSEEDAMSKFCNLMAAKMNSTCVNGSYTTSDGITWIIGDTNFGAGRPISDLPFGMGIEGPVAWEHRGGLIVPIMGVVQAGSDGKANIQVRVNNDPECADIQEGLVFNNNMDCAPNQFNVIVTRDGRVSVPAHSYAAAYLKEKDKTKRYNEIDLND